MKILKFGGGCLRDAAGFERAAGLVPAAGEAAAVVVSAVNGVTDRLLDALGAAKETRIPAPTVAAGLKELHAGLAGWAAGSADLPAVRADIERLCARVDRSLRGIALLGEATPPIQAEVLSCGERLAARVFAAVLEAKGRPARVVETDILGLTADRGHEEASVDWAASGPAFAAAADLLRKGDLVPVFTGFFGRAPDGRVATFGRNGSDYSAAAIARGLGADEVEFWKDADGFMTADPRWVKTARPVPRLSAAAAAELSYFGARVLHPRVFEALDGASTAVRLRNFRHPERPGTMILHEPATAAGVVISVTANPDAAVLRILGPAVGNRPGIIGRVGTRLAAAGVNILTVLTSQTAINLLLDGKDTDRGRRALAGESLDGVESVKIMARVGIVAVVGERLAETPGVAGRFFGALDRAGIAAAMVSSGASPAAIYAVVGGAEAIPAVRALHAAFFKKNRGTDCLTCIIRE